LPGNCKTIKISLFDLTDNLIDDLDSLSLSTVGIISNEYSKSDKIWISNYISSGNEINLRSEISTPGTASISIFDVNGSVVKSFNNILFNQGRNDMIISSDGISSGVYFFQIIKNNQVNVFRLLIK
jgi:hypothetical protein